MKNPAVKPLLLPLRARKGLPSVAGGGWEGVAQGRAKIKSEPLPNPPLRPKGVPLGQAGEGAKARCNRGAA